MSDSDDVTETVLNGKAIYQLIKEADRDNMSAQSLGFRLKEIIESARESLEQCEAEESLSGPEWEHA